MKPWRALVISLSAAASLLALACTTTDSARTMALAPCELPSLTRPARCGELTVPENPHLPNGRQISISVAVVPAASGRALSDPIAILMGGPGEDAISAAAIFATQFDALLRDRDLLLVDQRGTGRSGALNCDLFADADPATELRDLFPPAAVERCARQLQARADLTQYTFVQFANDLEHVRRALGYGPLNVSGGSYGTRAAQVYLRAYPQSVRTVYLGSVVPIDVPTPLTMAKSAEAALQSTLDGCTADAACRAAFPQLRDEFGDMVARLESGSVRVSLPGHAGQVPLNRGRVAEWFRSRLYRPGTAAVVPWLIDRAHRGDWQPIAEGIRTSARGLGSALSVGVFFSITCNEDVAFIGEADIERETQGTFLGDYRVRQQQTACRQWPVAHLTEGYRSLVTSSLPTLFVSGDLDAASPLWFTGHVARGFPNRAELVLGGRGHTEWSACVAAVYEQFVRDGTVRGVDVASCKPVPRPPFKTPEI
jgi:pimeloyl-ACP methyl ester carboxylesterase